MSSLLVRLNCRPRSVNIHDFSQSHWLFRGGDDGGGVGVEGGGGISWSCLIHTTLHPFRQKGKTTLIHHSQSRYLYTDPQLLGSAFFSVWWIRRAMPPPPWIRPSMWTRTSSSWGLWNICGPSSTTSTMIRYQRRSWIDNILLPSCTFTYFFH